MRISQRNDRLLSQVAVFATRNGTWHQVVNIERRWRQIRRDTGYEWVTPHTFRKTVATLISEATSSELASRHLGHSSSQVTRDHYIAKPPVSADLSPCCWRGWPRRMSAPPTSSRRSR